MRKLFKVVFLLVILFIFPLVVKANSISKIDIDIYLDDNGTAHVTETWRANLNQGTEGYKPYYNIGNAKITNFKVSENGKEYTYEDYWNTNASFNEKAYKNGIRYFSNSLELCWGISEYGYHDYFLTYDIEGFVASLTDADMVFWTLIPYELSPKPSDVHTKIYTDNYISQDVGVWGYGNYGGTAYVYDGYIEMNSEGALKSNEYMTILVKFDKGTFNTYHKLNQDFNYYLNKAEKGAIKYKGSSITKSERLPFFIIFLAMLCIIIPCAKSVKDLGNMIGSDLFIFKGGRKLPKNIPNNREIPFEKDIYRAFWVSECYRLNKNKTDFLGAILLKWLLENKISATKKKNGFLNKKEEIAIVLKTSTIFNDPIEEDLHKKMYEASIDGVLESKEFEKWCRKNYKEILKWFDDVLVSENAKLLKEGKIFQEERGIFSRTTVLVVDAKMKEDGIKLKGLKNFLEEFSRIDDKMSIEVNLWEYYLIFAQILGIADKVAKQFEKLYPELINKTNSDISFSFTDFVTINSIAKSSMWMAVSSKQKAYDYSAGGGGFSSGGGGGGSFGGGGGGGGFR